MDFDSNTEKLLRYIVYAIYIATSDDYSNFVQEYSSLDTHSGFGLMRANFINERLKDYIAKTSAMIHGFKRYSWQGRIVVDRENKQTFSVSTHANLKAVFSKKGRQIPHYLQSVLAVQNQKCYNPHEQLTLIDTCPFEYKTLENDYHDIMFSNTDEFKKYTHYVVAYTISSSGLLNVDLILFDSHFDEIERTTLNRFITPDYGKLTDMPVAKSASTTKSARNLVALKSGIKLNLVEMDKDE